MDKMHYRKVDNIKYLHYKSIQAKLSLQANKLEKEFKWTGKKLFLEMVQFFNQYELSKLEHYMASQRVIQIKAGKQLIQAAKS